MVDRCGGRVRSVQSVDAEQPLPHPLQTNHLRHPAAVHVLAHHVDTIAEPGDHVDHLRAFRQFERLLADDRARRRVQDHHSTRSTVSRPLPRPADETTYSRWSSTRADMPTMAA